MWHFCGKLPNGKYLYFNNSIVKIKTTPCPHKQTILPDFWWDYAKVVYADGGIKGSLQVI